MASKSQPDLMSMFGHDQDLVMKGIHKFAIEIFNGNDEEAKKKLRENMHEISKICQSSNDITKPKTSISRKRSETFENEVDEIQISKKNKLECKKLPNEIWLKIMNYLNTKDLITNMALVCKNFNNLTKEVKFLEFKDITELEANSVIKLLKNFKHLKEVTVATRSKAKDPQIMNQILGAAMDRKNLKRFEIFPVTTIKKTTMVFDLNQK